MRAQGLSPSDLPQSLVELIGLIGLDSAMALVDAHGGTTITVPMRYRADHWLARLIGEEAARALIDHYGGDRIEVPRCAAALRAQRDRAILDAWRRGHSQARLARQYRLTERGVRKIIRRAERSERLAKMQPTLFGLEEDE